MAKTDVFSGNSNYYLEIYTSLQSQNQAGNYSTIYWRVRVFKTYGDGLAASTNLGNYGWADSSRSGTKDLWNNSNLSYDFRNGSYTGNWTFASGTYNHYHNADGSGSYSVSAQMGLYNIGTAAVSTGSITLPSLARVPPAPRPLGFSNVTDTSCTYAFTSNGDGGRDIIEWQVGYGTNSSTPTYFISSSGTSNFSGMAPNTRYYFWSRGRNAIGWGPWSVVNAMTTLASLPPAPTPLSLTDITQTSMVYRFQGNGDGGSPILEWQIGFGTSPTTVQQTISSGGTSTVTGLSPGTMYYFWSRGRNARGWGAWSARMNGQTLAGAWIKVSGVWKLAVPYVRSGGVWKPTQPYVRTGGVWKQSN